MKGERLNWWLTITANIAVLIGIVLLIVELNQNRDMMRAQTRNELAMGIVGIQSGIAENEQLAAVLAKARDGETLSPGESLQFANRMLAMFRYWENVHYQYRMGLYDEVEFLKQKDAWEDYINVSDAQVGAWCRFSDTFSPEFAQEVDGIINQRSC